MWTRPVIEKRPLFVLLPEDENTSVHSKKTTRLQRYLHLLPSSDRFIIIIIIIIIGSIRIQAHLKSHDVTHSCTVGGGMRLKVVCNPPLTKRRRELRESSIVAVMKHALLSKALLL